MKKRIWMVTAAVFIGHMLFAVANNAQGVLLTSFIDAFGLSSASQGLPSAAANIGVLVAMLLAVSMAARIGKPALFILGAGLMGIMLALAGAAPSALWLSGAYLVMGFAFGCVDTTASALIADLHQGKRASLYMGVLHAVYGTGGVLAPVAITAALSAGASWRAVLFTLAVLLGLACLYALLTFRKAQGDLPVSAAPPSRVTRGDILAFVRRKGNMMLVLSIGLYCAHQCSVFLWISRIIGVGYGNDALGAAALALFWLGTVASRLITPLTGIGTVWYMRYGMAATALILGIGTAIGGAIAVCIAAALAGLVGGASLPMTLTEINRRNPERSMLAITAVLLTTSVSAIIASPLIGFIVGQTTLIAGLVVSAVFAALSAAAAFGVKEA